MSARILVVDDDPAIAAAVRRALLYEGYSVDISGDGEGALQRCRDEAFDLVVLDVMLPGVDGVEVCRRLRSAGEAPAVLMLTARDATADRVRGLDSGADDYLVKPFANDELLARVRALLRRAAPSAPSQVLRFADVRMDLDAHRVERGGRAVELTPKQFDLLEHFLRNPRRVLSRDQLLDAVWGYDAATASNVVDVYVGYVRERLEDGGARRLLHTVRGVGYVLRETP